MRKMFSVVPSNKNLLNRENREKISVYFPISYDRITKTPILPHAKFQMAVFGITVTFITQKLKSKRTLSLPDFSLVTGFFEGTGENIVHIFLAEDTYETLI